MRHRRLLAHAIAAAVSVVLVATIVSAQPAAPVPPATDNALLERLATADPVAGAVVGSACLGCHTIEAGGAALTGPNLFGIVGAPVARTAGFTYSPAMAALGASGATWTYDLLDAFLTSPFVTVLGTRMGFGGIPDPVQRANLIAWLRLQSEAPVEIAGFTQADPTRPVFEGYQADSGRLFFGEQACGDCHGPTGGGTAEGPPLRGAAFEANWNGRTVWDLFNFTRRTQPPGAPGGMEDQMIARILSYVLELNGYVGGAEPFLVDRQHLELLEFKFPL